MISLCSVSSELHSRDEAIPQPANSPQIVPLFFAITQLEVYSISLSCVNDVRHANPSNLGMLCILSLPSSPPPAPAPVPLPLLLLFMFFAISL